MIWANLTITLKIMRQVSKIDYSHFTIPLVKDPTGIHVLSVSSDKCLPVRARGAITARRIRENLTDYWGVSVKSVSLLIKSE